MYRFWSWLLRLSGVGTKREKSYSSNFSSANEARLADLLANATDVISLYDRDLRLTHFANTLKSNYGRVVVPGAALWEIYPSFLDPALREELDRVLRKVALQQVLTYGRLPMRRLSPLLCSTPPMGSGSSKSEKRRRTNKQPQKARST